MATNQAVTVEEKKTSQKLDKYSMTVDAYELGITNMLKALPPIPRQVRK